MKRVGLVLFSMVAIALICSGSALAQGDNSTYFVTYYSNNVSGAPDATVRAINDGSAGAYGGNLFADFYVFDDSEELITCCSCDVTPDGLLSESVRGELTKYAIRNFVPTRGVIKVISSSTAFNPVKGTPPPNGTAETPTAGLRLWATHIQRNNGGYVQTETAFADSNWTSGEQALLELICWADIQQSGTPCYCTPEDYDF
jgi:hypothetical protein